MIVRDEVISNIKRKLVEIRKGKDECEFVEHSNWLLNMDSIEYLTLIVYLEDYYCIEIDDDLLINDAFNTIDGLVEYVISNVRDENE